MRAGDARVRRSPAGEEHRRRSIGKGWGARRGRKTTEKRDTTTRGKGGCASENGGVAREEKAEREGRAREGRAFRAKRRDGTGGQGMQNGLREVIKCGKERDERVGDAQEGGRTTGEKKTDASAPRRVGARRNDARRRTASTRSGVGVAEAVPTASAAP